MPCSSFPKTALRLPSLEEIGSVVSKSDVCPVDALQIDSRGDLRIDAVSCIGCGLCLANCPVGAIYLDSESGLANVELQSSETGSYEANVLEIRDKWAEFLEFNVPSQAKVNNQLEKITNKLLDSGLSTTNLNMRMLVRNALISLGASAALRTQGANSLLSEIVAQEGDRTYLVEVETNADTLDAFRRLVSASARAINSLGVRKTDLALVLVVPQLPNKRVDFYRLVKDARIYLGLRILVIPFAALFAGVILRRKGLEETFGEFIVEEGRESLTQAAEKALGFRFAEGLGLKPSK